MVSFIELYSCVSDRERVRSPESPWRDLSDPGLFTMIDPLDVIDGPYLVLDGIEQSPELIDTSYLIESNSTS